MIIIYLQSLKTHKAEITNMQLDKSQFSEK